MIDFHAHILPGMDDGSQSVEESMQMIDKSFKQGVEILVATPHFYPWREKPQDFLNRRKTAVERLALLPEKVRLGAEVAYYEGIVDSEDIEGLKIDKTDFLLMEMPMAPWTNRMIDALHMLEGRSHLKVVLAHLDRYVTLQKRTDNIDYVCQNFLIQVNADYFISRRSQRKALKLFNEGVIDFIGSDCHNMTSRPPNMEEAYQIIENKLGNKSVRAFKDKQIKF